MSFKSGSTHRDAQGAPPVYVGSSGYSSTVLMNQNVCVWENPSESNPMVETEVTSRHEVLPDAASFHAAHCGHGPTPSRSGYAVGAWEITCQAILLWRARTAHNQITERRNIITHTQYGCPMSRFETWGHSLPTSQNRDVRHPAEKLAYTVAHYLPKNCRNFLFRSSHFSSTLIRRCGASPKSTCLAL